MKAEIWQKFRDFFFPPERRQDLIVCVYYYPEYFRIIQPGHQNKTFRCKHLSWLDQAVLLSLLIFIPIGLDVL